MMMKYGVRLKILPVGLPLVVPSSPRPLSVEIEEMFRKDYAFRQLHPEGKQQLEDTSERHRLSNQVDRLPMQSHIQPMKAGIYFDSPEGFGNWNIYMVK